MFSFNCWIRNSDVHLIYDENNNRINYSKNIIIGDHVWVGQNVSILKGSYVGSGSVIGLGSVITKKITSNDIYAGNPCKRVRENIIWNRQSTHFFTEEETSSNDKFYDDATLYKFDKKNNLNEWISISEKTLVDLNKDLIIRYAEEICELE